MVTFFLEFFVALVFSGPLQTLFSRSMSCQLVTFLVSLASRTLSVSVAAPIAYWIRVLEAISGCGAERVWLVRLSQKLVSITKATVALVEQASIDGPKVTN